MKEPLDRCRAGSFPGRTVVVCLDEKGVTDRAGDRLATERCCDAWVCENEWRAAWSVVRNRARGLEAERTEESTEFGACPKASSPPRLRPERAWGWTKSASTRSSGAAAGSSDQAERVAGSNFGGWGCCCCRWAEAECQEHEPTAKEHDGCERLRCKRWSFDNTGTECRWRRWHPSARADAHRRTRKRGARRGRAGSRTTSRMCDT